MARTGKWSKKAVPRGEALQFQEKQRILPGFSKFFSLNRFLTQHNSFQVQSNQHLKGVHVARCAQVNKGY